MAFGESPVVRVSNDLQQEGPGFGSRLGRGPSNSIDNQENIQHIHL